MMNNHFYGAIFPNEIEVGSDSMGIFNDLGNVYRSDSSFGETIVSAFDKTVSSDGLIAITSGQPRWPDNIPGLNSDAKSNPDKLLALYRVYGNDWPEKTSGHFAAAIVNTINGEVQLAVDKIGIYSLYFGISDDGTVVFGTRPIPLLSVNGFGKEISAQSIYHYIYFHMIPSPGTIYKSLQKMTPASHLVIKNRSINKRTYWIPEFEESSSYSTKELEDKLHVALKKSVQAEMEDGVAIGSYLSGGLDSSTITGKLSEISKEASSFTIGFDAEGYDEVEFAREAARHFGVSSYEYYVTPDDVVDAVRLLAKNFDEPFGNSSALPSYFCAKLAKEKGVSVLLAGDGGDEIFAGNERYATQQLFETYLKIPEWFRKSFIESPLKYLKTVESRGFFKKANSFITQAEISLPDRMQRYNFLHQMSAEDIFKRDLLNQIENTKPIEWLRKRYQQPFDATSLNRMLYMDWKFTLGDNDIRKVSQTAELAGVDVRYPMLSDDMVNMSCLVPSKSKLKRGDLRHFYRKAMIGYLPDTVLRKSKHGFGLPFGLWMKDYPPLMHLAEDCLEKLKKRDYFNHEFISKAIESHRSGHAGYYGELIWILMMLELWLEAHDSSN